MITKKEKIKIITDRIEQININIDWLSSNMGILEEIPGDKPTMEQQLNSNISRREALQAALDELI